MKKARIAENFDWVVGPFLIAYHLLLLISVPLYWIFYGAPSWGLLLASFVLMYVSGLSVTMGYHRLFAHTAYKAHPVVEAVLVFFATLAAQGSVQRWSYDHRHHHAFVDTDRDPYSIKKGFWFAHFIWLLQKQKTIEPKVIADLQRRPLLNFQHRYYGWCFAVLNLLAFWLLGYLFHDYVGAMVFGVFGRMFVLHHCTWFINSLAHTWGARNFCQELSAVDNYVIALLTFGEGYHNYHHTFAYDYRNGIRWYHFDPTKWLIWSLSKLRLAHGLRRVQTYQIQEKLLIDRKQVLIAKIRDSLHGQKGEWERKVSQVIDNVLIKLKEMRRLHERYTEVKKEKSEELVSVVKAEIDSMKASLAEEQENWQILLQDISSCIQPGQHAKELLAHTKLQ